MMIGVTRTRLEQRRSRAIAWAAVALAFGLGVVACGGDGGQSGARATVGDFSVVQVGDRTVDVGPDGTAAVIRLTTDPATICAVSFGESETLGRIANDPGMGGTAISDHNVALRGLTPNSTYHFVLTATDAAGRVYQTKPQTFSTKVSEERAVGGDANIARGARILDVSSEFGAAFGAANAFDGDLSTEWSSAGDGNDASVTIDLDEEREVTSVAFRTREMSDGSSITRSFTVVVDGGKRLGPFPAGDRQAANAAKVAFTGKVLRFDVEDSTGGNTGAAEIEVYGSGNG